MANYTTKLKTFGGVGTEYPTGYSYTAGEQPVDEWDDFLAYNTIEDLKALISTTNSRIETDKGLAGGEPAAPETSHIYHDEDNNDLKYWDAVSGKWHRLLRADGDKMSGPLDFDRLHAIKNLNHLTFANGTAHIKTKGNGTSYIGIWDTFGTQLVAKFSEGGDVAFPVGGVTIQGNTAWHAGNGGAGSGLDADTVDGKHVGEHEVYATYADVPTTLAEGTVVYVQDEDKLYVEDGN